jgi:RNA polymerase sigma-70 factor (ECF subfamily)
MRENPSSLDDLGHVREVLSGNREAYTFLVRRHQEKVRGLCLALLQRTAEADDAAQDVFMKAYQNLGRFRQDAAFSTWLYRIAHNHCLDLLKQRTRRSGESLDALLEKGDNVLFLPERTPPPGATEDPRTFLADLTPEHRTVLVLRELQGFSYDEIAHAMETTVDSVKARLQRARRALIERARHFLTSPGVQTSETPHEP